MNATTFKALDERARERARARASGIARNARTIARFSAALSPGIAGSFVLLADTIDEIVAMSEAQERG